MASLSLGAAAALLAACGEVRSAGDPDAGDGRAPALKLVSAQELGVIPEAASIQGRSGGQSARLWGKSVWSFATTVLNIGDDAGSNWHFNSVSSTDDLIGDDGVLGFVEPTDTVGAPRHLIEPTAREAAFNAEHATDQLRYETRPTGAIFDEAGDRALLFYELVYTSPGTYAHTGQSIAFWSGLDAVPERPVVAPSEEHPTSLFRAGEPGFGTGTQIDGDQLYTFACAALDGGYVSPCKLAQVPLADLLVRDSWRFWDGEQFSSELDDAAPVFDGSGAISTAWNGHLKRWVAIYAEPLSSWVMARTAPALSGPWSEPVELFQAPPREDGWWVYDAVMHDEFTQADGRTLYVSYSRPNSAKGLFGSDLVWVRVDIEATDD
jgi:hypothetical protein